MKLLYRSFKTNNFQEIWKPGVPFERAYDGNLNGWVRANAEYRHNADMNPCGEYLVITDNGRAYIYSVSEKAPSPPPLVVERV